MQLTINQYTVVPFAIGLIVIGITLTHLIKTGEWIEHATELIFLFVGSMSL